MDQLCSCLVACPTRNASDAIGMHMYAKGIIHPSSAQTGAAMHSNGCRKLEAWAWRWAHDSLASCEKYGVTDDPVKVDPTVPMPASTKKT